MMTDTEKLIIELKSEELENRLYAAEDLLELLDEVVVNELINALAIERSQIVKEALVTALVPIFVYNPQAHKVPSVFNP